MLCLAVEFLTGYYVATHPSARDRTEWPPHPARLFMALAAAYFESGEDPADAVALTFIESMAGAPDIFASHAEPRSIVTHYVPVNDTLGPAGASLPILRSRQPRVFPRVRPDDPVIYYCWGQADADAATLQALRNIAGKVTRIGHSSSLVRVWIAESPPGAGIRDRWTPDDEGAEMQVRTITPGSLAELRRLYRSDDVAAFMRLDTLRQKGTAKEKKSAKDELTSRFGNVQPQPVRPNFQITSGYRVVGPSQEELVSSVWSDRLLVFGIQPLESTYPRMNIASSPALVAGLRRALLKVSEPLGPIPEFISGHKSDSQSSPSDQAHCAILPLPFVGREHADGHILGVAIAIPRNVTAAARNLVRRAMSTITERGLTLGRIGKWKLVPEAELPSLHSLRNAVWTGGRKGSRIWSSVTPVSFDEHPKAKDIDGYQNKIREMLTTACARVGLPGPEHIDISHISFVGDGAPAAFEFTRLARKDGSLRRHLHARLIFSGPVLGPVVLGAGRYRGYGLFRPMAGGEGNE